MLYGHGDDRYLYNKEIIADFSSNVWWQGIPLNLVQNIIAKNIEKISRYPEPCADSLIDEIAGFWKIPNEQVLATNGAIEAFYYVAKFLERTSATIFTPTFSEYEDACNVHNIKTEFQTFDYLNHFPKFESQLVFICNPNNPTGKVLSRTFLLEMIRLNPNVFFVIDETYIELTNKTQSLIGFHNKLPNLIITRSLTKTFGVPGLRIGYLIANDKVVDNLKKVKIPWSVNSIAIEVGKHIIQNYDVLLPNFANAVSESNQLAREIRNIDGIVSYPSHSTFFLSRLKNGKAATLKHFLIENFGVLIRDASNFRGLDDTYFRVSLQSDKDNATLLAGLQAFSKIKPIPVSE